MSEEPRPKKKKRRRKAKPEPEPETPQVEASEEDASEEEASKEEASEEEASEEAEVVVPLPGLGTPDGDKLRAAHVAFEGGDYQAVRKLCRALEADAEDDAVKAAAEELRSRVEIDPIQVVVLLACAAAVVAIIFRWIL